MKKEQPAPNDESPSAAPVADRSQVIAIEIEDILPSSFETQARRRARFKPDEIESLGASIAKHKMRQPILVRPQYPNFEIVFGERRFLAAKLINLPTINCFIDHLTDAEVLELQYEENHRRQENTALDDAFLFKFLMEKYGYSEEQLADRLNTSRRNVVEKLKLNDLIKDAVAELEAGSLPLKHAYYLAKFPAATQAEIVREKYAYKYNDSSEKPVSFDEFKREVEENILRRLGSAPFNIGDPRLHIKQLICVSCPEQTGTQSYLFPDHARSGDARCLNPGCFRLKTDTHLKLARQSIALETKTDAIQSSEDLREATAAVPLVTTNSYAPERNPFGREKVLTSVVPLPAPECEFSESSLAVGGERKGEQVYICREKGCAVHDPQPVKIFDQSEIHNRARLEVFRRAMEDFDDYRTFWQFDDLIKTLIVNLLMETVNYPSGHRILRLVNNWKLVPHHFHNRAVVEKFVETFDKKQQSQILFLLTHQNELFTNSSDYLNADGIRAIAADYTKLDYDRLAEEIREQSQI